MADGGQHQYKLTEVYKARKPFSPANVRERPQDLRKACLEQPAAKQPCYGLDKGPADQMHAQQPQQQSTVPQGNRPDLDFATFYQKLNQEQQQHVQHQQHQYNPAVHQGQTHYAKQEQQQQQQQQQGFDKLRWDQQQDFTTNNYLDELLHGNSLAAPQPQQQMQTLLGLDRSFPPDASRDCFLRDPAAAGGSSAAATGGAAAARASSAAAEWWHLQQLGVVPWDWSVKNRVRLSSAAPFKVLDEQRTASFEPVCNAVQSSACCKVHMCAQEQLAGGLLQWQHPAAPLSNSMLAALRALPDSSSSNVGSLVSRVAAWREALQSVFLALRHGHCAVFYVAGQAFRQPFTAVFFSAGLLGCHQVTAVVSRSNRPFRQHLAAFAAEGVLVGNLEQQQQPGRQALAPVSFDGQPGSQLLLSGTMQVHGLYAALLNLPWCAAEQPDVPVLTAPVQFVHAQLCQLRLQVLRDSVLQQQQDQEQQARQLAGISSKGPIAVPLPLHWAELSGPAGIMPWTLHRLMQLIRETQADAGFDAYIDTEPCSTSLNLMQNIWQQAQAAVAAGAAGSNTGRRVQSAGAECKQQPSGWGWSSEQQQLWQQSTSLLQGRVLRQLRLKDRNLAARLA